MTTDPFEIAALEQDAETLAAVREQLDFARVMLQGYDPNIPVPLSMVTDLLSKLSDLAKS